jgi:hypothetical protein
MLPEDQAALTAATQDRAQRLMTLPGVRTDAQRFDSTMVTDQRTGDEISLADMRGRVMDRSSMAYQGREEARVARDLAARQARIDAAQAQGAAGPISPLQQRMDRNMERFLMTPEGTMWAAEQQQGMAAQQQEMAAANQWQVINDPTTRRPLAMVNARGQTLSLPQIGKNERIIYREIRKPFDPDNPILGTYVEKIPSIYNEESGTLQDIPMQGETTAQPSAAAGDAGAGGGGGAAGGAGAKPVPRINTQAEWAKLPAGTQYMAPDGQMRIKK